MPELPDVAAYIHALERRIAGQELRKFSIISPFVLRTVDPPPELFEGKIVKNLRRIGKRIVFEFEGKLFIVVHLMIAGRWRWADQPHARPPGRITLASLLFEHGTLHLIEAGTKKRASIHLVQGEEQLASFARGGMDVMACSPQEFAQRLRSENHTLKRSLTDPRMFDGIGNAYSDEILHAAGLSPLQWTTRLTDDEAHRLHRAARELLGRWTEILSKQFAEKFPGAGEVTAFRPEFAVHGKFKQPCPRCGTAVQRIVYAENETNYCPRCQTGGKILADRALSRLLHDDWPRTVEELEKP